MKKKLIALLLLTLICVTISSTCFAQYYCYIHGEPMTEYCSNICASEGSWTCSFGGTDHHAKKEYWWTHEECPVNGCTTFYPKTDDHVEWTRHWHRDCMFYGLKTWCPY